MQHFSEVETRLLWPGPAGDIEMITTQGKKAITVIICHPHPLFGGTMGNKVVTTMAKTFHDHDLSTIRFNFRGVGKSAGVHDQGLGETEDVLANYLLFALHQLAR
jgi:alpha/beta superfamily hydrolase